MLICLIEYMCVCVCVCVCVCIYIYVCIYWHEIYGTYILAIYVCMVVDMKYN